MTRDTSPASDPDGRATLSVVMPAYNEEGAIRRAVDEVCRSVLDVTPESELVVVNDGSKDRTGEILDELAAADSRVRVIHSLNGGHGAALMKALDAARGERLFMIDSDCQIPLVVYADLAAALDAGADAAFGVRRRRGDNVARRVLTRVIRWSLVPLFGVRLHDANVPCKVVRASDWRAARSLLPDDTLAPSLFLAVFLSRTGRRIAEVDVEHVDRETGEVSIKHFKLFKFCARAFTQLVAFRRELARQ